MTLETLVSFSMHKNDMFSSDSLSMAFVERRPGVVGGWNNNDVRIDCIAFFRISIVTTSEGSSHYTLA